jgi:prolyl oligopeptidase
MTLSKQKSSEPGPSRPAGAPTGRSISDPYRWMEEDSPAVRTWVHSQHEQTMAQLRSLPAREIIRTRLEELMGPSVLGSITRAGDRYFFRQRSDHHELAALYCRDGLQGVPRLLLDPNELSTDGTITLADVHPSADGSLIAYRLSEAGNSCRSLHVMDIESRTVLPDLIPREVNPVAHAWHTKNRVAWLPDNRGFYYTRCRDVEDRRFQQKLYFHRLGDDGGDDPMFFGESLTREQTPYPYLSSDGRYLVVLVQDLSALAPRSEVYLLDREHEQLGFVPLIPGLDAFVSALIHRNRLYLRTNHEAPRGKIIAAELAHLAAGEVRFTTVIPEGAHPLGAWVASGNHLMVETIENVSSRLRVYDLAGRLVKQIPLPEIGSIGALSAAPESKDLLISFSSFLIPPTIYRLNLETCQCELYHRRELPFDPDAFQVDQVWFESLDQTPIPMFLLHKRGIERDGANPAVIHGYGGFGVSLTPAFMAQVIPFVERGGIYAVVNARGGGEFGEAWHRAGVRENRPKVFQDFIGAGEWLIAQGYTRAARLGCFGWSNGGLTVNAVAVQRPELWKAVVAGAPVTDMARFHTAHGGRHWLADYGSPDSPADLDFLMRYSPYHTLPPEIAAPAMLTIAPDNDDRVAPWHSYKMHRAWQAANVSPHPILLRGEPQAGHLGSPKESSAIARYADIWAFFFWQLGID